MRYWVFVEPSGDDCDCGAAVFGHGHLAHCATIAVIVRRFSDAEILAEFWEYWIGQMITAGKAFPLMTEEHCIEDFVTLNWASLDQ